SATREATADDPDHAEDPSHRNRHRTGAAARAAMGEPRRADPGRGPAPPRPGPRDPPGGRGLVQRLRARDPCAQQPVLQHRGARHPLRREPAPRRHAAGDRTGVEEHGAGAAHRLRGDARSQARGGRRRLRTRRRHLRRGLRHLRGRAQCDPGRRDGARLPAAAARHPPGHPHRHFDGPPPMITIHHLSASRSERIVWLAEELGIAYELRWHQREPNGAAPAALREVHALGKSPVIEDEGLVLAESGAIVEYIVNRHGAGRLAVKPEAPEYPGYVYWMHFAEGSLMTL